MVCPTKLQSTKIQKVKKSKKSTTIQKHIKCKYAKKMQKCKKLKSTQKCKLKNKIGHQLLVQKSELGRGFRLSLIHI